MSRGNDGRFQSAVVEVSGEDLVTRVLCGHAAGSIHIDWQALTPLISSALDRMRETEINDSFKGLWSHWCDTSSYPAGPVRHEKFFEVSRWGIETLAKLQSAVTERRATLGCHTDASPESALNMCSQYLAALMCCVHAKRELSVDSFSGEVVFSSYAQWIEEVLLDAYCRCMDVWQRKIGNASHLYALALDEDPELHLYTLPLEGLATIDADLRFEYVRSHMNRDDRQGRIVIDAVLLRKPDRHRRLARRLRDLALWAKAVSALISSLGKPSMSTDLRE